jgi:cell division protein FtsI (penicillin-binding protein 3)
MSRSPARSSRNDRSERNERNERDGRSDGRGRGTPAARWRVWVVVGLVVVGFSGVGWKASRLQLGLGDELRSLAEEQYLRTVPITAPRGAIVDRGGRPLAVSLPAWSVFIEPKNVVDAEVTAERLGAALGVPPSSLMGKLTSGRAFYWLERRVSPEVEARVRALDLPGVGLRKEWRRTWPNKQLAAQVLGSVDVDGTGRGGVEQLYEDQLRGDSVRLDAIADNKGDRVAIVADGDASFDLAELTGDDVVLTIDLALQQVATEALERTRDAFRAKSVYGLVLDAKTGAIRAAAQAPAFNPNTGEGDRRNHAIADAVEPGSIFKIATFTAAFDGGVLAADELINCEGGKFQLGKHVIHDSHKLGVVPAREVFAASSNIGTLKIAQRLGEERFRESLTRFGFGTRPGTGLLDETRGRLPAQARWGDARLATVSFGHGVMVSALQVASLVQAIANDGVQKTPYLVERVQAATGEVLQQHADDGGKRIMKRATAATMLSVMEGVTLPGGTGVLAAMPGVRAGGKTGTAEKVDPATGRYSRSKNLSSFVGTAPLDNPRYVAIVLVDEPEGLVFGGQVAAPAWREIMERALLLDGQPGVASFSPTVDELKAAAKAAKLAKATKNAGDAKGAKADKGAGTVEADIAAVVDIGDEPTGAPAGLVPDLRGMSARGALRAASAAGHEVQLSGSGVVVQQSPLPGETGAGPIQLTLALLDEVRR